MYNNKIKAVIFDVDGVIFKAFDKNGNYLWSQNIKNDLGITSKHFSLIFSEKWNDVIRGKLSFSKHLAAVFEEALFQNISVSPQEFIDYWLSKDNHINTDILKLIQSFPIPCYLGTNQEDLRTSQILDLVGTYFKGCFASYKIGFAKPEQEFFQHIESTLLLKPCELLFIDDTKSYIEGAQQCGWHTYHYQDDIKNLENFLSEMTVNYLIEVS